MELQSFICPHVLLQSFWKNSLCLHLSMTTLPVKLMPTIFESFFITVFYGGQQDRKD